MKRFQECNRIEKVWRYRWYLLLPLKWFWRNHIVGMTIGIDEEDENGNIVDSGRFYVPTGKNLWKLLVGEAQMKMGWYYTHEEVLEKLKKYE